MSQTGGLSTSSPRTALSNSGSIAVIAFGSATVAPNEQHMLGLELERREVNVDLDETEVAEKEEMEQLCRIDIVSQYFWAKLIQTRCC